SGRRGRTPRPPRPPRRTANPRRAPSSSSTKSTALANVDTLGCAVGAGAHGRLHGARRRARHRCLLDALGPRRRAAGTRSGAIRLFHAVGPTRLAAVSRSLRQQAAAVSLLVDARGGDAG